MNLVGWNDQTVGKLRRTTVDTFACGFDFVSYGEWQMLISKEEKDVYADRSVNITVRRIVLPKCVVVVPCHVKRHPLGTVIAVDEGEIPKKIEEKRNIDSVVFYPLTDGTILIDDLLGVVNLIGVHSLREHKKKVFHWVWNEY